MTHKRHTGSSRPLSTGKRMTIFVLLILLVLIVLSVTNIYSQINNDKQSDFTNMIYDGEITADVNNGIPAFSMEEISRAECEVFEEYSKLDKLGRCGPAMANICRDIMPDEYDERTSLGSIYPSGWQSINFWSRCHLIGYQLAAENDNERNLITGTSRMNLSGMLPIENRIAGYISENPKNHVLLKVEPVFDGDNLVASGVHMQARSVEDQGEGISINTYIYNIQPGYIINYKNGHVEDDPDHQTSVFLEDMVAKYTGEPIGFTEAVVTGSTGTIKYIYFIDSETSEKTSVLDGAEYNGGAPSEEGTYYVKAVVSGDNYYPSAVSNTAKLIIQR